MSVSGEIIAVLEALCEKFGLAIDWTSANVLPYLTDLCSRICGYEIATSIGVMIISTIFLIIGLVFWKIFTHKKNINFRYWNTPEEVLYVCGWFVFGLCILQWFIVMSVQTFDIIEAVYLPEITIMEKINNLMEYGTL